jgi:hypothetical protein
MFSVNNFYEFFKSYYGWEKTRISPLIFCTHGSKNLYDVHPLVEKRLHTELPSMELSINNALFLHDQEPFFYNHSMDIYRNTLLENKKDPLYLNMTDQELFFLRIFRTCSWPIFCHSEKNSKDIDLVERDGCIPCFYFWHGLIARDWFRHWKHHSEIHNKVPWNKRFLLYIRDCSGTRTYRHQIKNLLYDIKDQIDTDWENTRNISADYSAKISIEDAQKTAVHIVAETVFNDTKIHVTEKTFKAVVMKQPFIVFAGPGTLQFLRNYGFRTFGDIWDESYDQEMDHTTRLIKITTLIKDLYHKSQHEFQKIIEQCREIVDYNQRYFFSDDFETRLLDELHNNMQASISEQQRRSLNDPGGSLFFMYDNVLKREIQIPDLMIEFMEKIVEEIKTRYPARYSLIRQKYHWVD